MWSLISDESESKCDAGQPLMHLLTTGWRTFVKRKAARVRRRRPISVVGQHERGDNYHVLLPLFSEYCA